MVRLLPFLLLAVVVYIALRAIRTAASTPDGQFKCVDCRNRREVFGDGVICAYGSKETFKTKTHIANCTDYQRGKPR